MHDFREVNLKPKKILKIISEGWVQNLICLTNILCERTSLTKKNFENSYNDNNERVSNHRPGKDHATYSSSQNAVLWHSSLEPSKFHLI